MSSLGEELPKEIKRSVELLSEYAAIGKPGIPAMSLIKVDINEGIDALSSGDVIRMMRIYETLKGNV